MRNKTTGQEYTANNRDGAALDRADMHPIIRDRVEAQDQVIDTNQRLLTSGMSTDDINKLTPEQMRAELAADGVAPTVQGMDTAAQLRSTNDRVKFRQSREPDTPYQDHLDGIRSENGQHGEVVALNNALKESPNATHEDLHDYELYNQRLPRGKSKPVSDRAMPRCECCRGTTAGVSAHPDLAEAESYVDQQQEGLW